MPNPNNNVTIHPCPFDNQICSNYLCRQTIGKSKFYIGVEGGHASKPIFCEDCMKNLVHSLPPELYENGEKLEERLRAEIGAEYELKMEQFKIENTQYLTDKISGELMIQHAFEGSLLNENDELDDESMADKDDADKEEDEQPTMAYRCLDCGEEFDTPQKLGAHKRKHK